MKPVKFGVKFFELCDAKTGYCKNFTMNAGQDNQQARNLGKTGKVVMDLLKDLYNTNHHLYVDNFYTSPILFLMLKERGILSAGTARPRRGYLYDQLKRIQLGKCGDVAWLTAKDQRMTALRWNDKKDVFFFSTIHPSPVVPAWLANNDPGPESDDERDQSDLVHRREGLRQLGYQEDLQATNCQIV